MTARILLLRTAARELDGALAEVARLDGARTWQGPAAERFRSRRALWQGRLRDDADRLARRAAGPASGPDAA